MSKADYDIVRVEEDRVFIIDLDLGNRSVTNDAEIVWHEIQEEYPGRRVIYRDSLGSWDEITLGQYGEVIFLPYKEYAYNEKLSQSL